MNNTEDNNRIQPEEENKRETEEQKDSSASNKETPKDIYTTQGRPITKQDRWCNRLVFIGLIGVILFGGYHIFSTSTAEAATEPALEAETAEEDDIERGEPIDEESMPPTATEERIVADTLNDDFGDEFNSDSLDMVIPDTATHHATEHSSHSNENNKQHTVEPNDSTMHTM